MDVQLQVLKRSKLGRMLCRLVGTRKAVRLIKSLLLTPNADVNWHSKCLDDGFYWHETEQGFMFWCNLADKYDILNKLN